MTPSIEKELDDASGISIIEIAGPRSQRRNIITQEEKSLSILPEHRVSLGLDWSF